MTQRPSGTLVPKLHLVLQEGYRLSDLRADLAAGLTVAVVALPLSMALAIASGATPDKGLITAIVAGFLISALGGSRVQIGGPTGAFHGYTGLVCATLMAGVMLLIAAALRLGRFIHLTPSPVITGFTAGIAVIIATSQLPDALGLPHLALPALLMTLAAMIVIEAMTRYAPRLPSLLIATAGAAGIALLLHLPVDTIVSRFCALPSSLPGPHMPKLSTGLLLDLLPSAFNIALLAGIESLLSAKVADRLTGGQHRANAELMAQGVANIASSLFGGLPATGAIARTATNIRAGAKSPMAGVFHAGFIALAMWLFALLMGLAPLPALAAILLIVAWNMSEADRLPTVLRGPWRDAVVLAVTFFMTVFSNLTVAIIAGIALHVVLHRLPRKT